MFFAFGEKAGNDSDFSARIIFNLIGSGLRICFFAKQNLIFLIMRSVFLFLGLLYTGAQLPAQSPVFASKLIDYRPAPGQHINDPASGTPSVALKILNGIGNPLSLGAYGGYIVFGFTNPIDNHFENPYGVDFIIYGNASQSHAEPGIIKVMRDVNKNGIPDETWYEIAGSAHNTPAVEKGYSVRYFNPENTSAADVQWVDNQGNTGKVSKNSFHLQPYYPLKTLFPEIDSESLSFSGSKLMGNVRMQNGIYCSPPYAFGYADNITLNSQSPSGIPDNPYTLEIIEGDGGDAIDISWAIDDFGNYIELPEIDFVMIYTGLNESAGWLGEISTDIRGIADVQPNSDISGPMNMIVADELPAKILLNDNLNLSARALFSGRLKESEEIIWESMSPEILEIAGNTLYTKRTGEAEIHGSLLSDPACTFTKSIQVVEPAGLLFDRQIKILQKGDSCVLKYSFIDNTGEELHGLIPEVIIENEEIVQYSGINEEQLKFTGISEGTTLVSLIFKDNAELNCSFQIQVIHSLAPIQISFSLSFEDYNLLPSKKYYVGKADILRFTDRFQPEFNPDRAFISLADAITSVLQSEGFGSAGKSLAFRQDEYGGDGLYVWQIGYDWEYQYGWGGSKKSNSYAKTWFAIINNSVFASGFDSIKVAEGDRISLRHISDNSISWNFIRIIPDTDKIFVGDTIGFLSEQVDVFPTVSGGFSVSGPFPVINASVVIDPGVVFADGSDDYTSFSGKFSLSFNKPGMHKVSVDGSEPFLVDVSFTNHIESKENLAFFPNPCYDKLSIWNPEGLACGIKIFSMDGVLKESRYFDQGETSLELNLSHLNEGMYILEYNNKENNQRQKFYKL